MENCLLCGFKARNFVDTDPIKVDCNLCGSYQIDRNVLDDGDFDSLNKAEKGLLRGMQYHNLVDTVITPGFINSQVRGKKRNLELQANKLLRYIESKTPLLGDTIRVDHAREELISASYSASEQEMHYLLKEILEKELEYVFTKDAKGENKFCITPKGRAYLSGLQREDSKNIFVAMWFDEKVNSVYEQAIKPAIEGCGFIPSRIDKKEHVNKICDEMIVEIKRSRCVIADLSGHRGGVYYEAGFAHGLGLEVIFACKDIYFNKRHFDIRQFNCIKWSENKLEAFCEALTSRIRARLC